MNWAHNAIEKLKLGQDAELTPRGSSMKGKVDDGSKVIVTPPKDLEVGDVVLVKVHGNVYLHLIKAMQGERYQIGNNRGGINGWVNINAIYGVAVSVNDKIIKKFS